MISLKVTPAQAEILSDRSRIKVLACGRRWGKTTLLAFAALKTAIEFPGCKVWILGQNYARSLDVKASMERSEGFKKFLLKPLAQFPPRLIMRNGSTIAFRSFDHPDGLLGSGLKLICLDEAALAPKRLYQQTLLPMIADTDGQMYLASNFSQGKNWFWDMAQEGLRKESWAHGVRTWELASSTGLAFQGVKGRARLEWFRNHLPRAVFECEFENKPLAGVDSVFRWTSANEKGLPLKSPQPGRRYAMGLDLGRVVDPSAAIVMDDQGQVVFSECFAKGTSHALQAERAAQIQRLFGATCVADSTGGGNPAGEPYFKHYRAAIPGLREYTWTRENKFRLINALALEIEQGRIFAPTEFEDLISQVKAYKFVEGDMGFVRYGAPKGCHDDLVAAMAMANWAVVSNWLPDPTALPFAAY
jgi:hypothetical protein